MATHYEALPNAECNIDALTLKRHHLADLIHLDDPATEAFIDFKKIPAATVSPKTELNHLLSLVQDSNRYVLMVTNNKQQLVGLISAAYLLSSMPIRLIAENDLKHEEVTAEMLMTPVEKIVRLDAWTLTHSCVGHIIATLQAANKNYAVVIEKTEAEHGEIMGIFALPLINKHMIEDVNLKEKRWAKKMNSVATMQHEEIG